MRLFHTIEVLYGKKRVKQRLDGKPNSEFTTVSNRSVLFLRLQYRMLLNNTRLDHAKVDVLVVIVDRAFPVDGDLTNDHLFVGVFPVVAYHPLLRVYI